MIDIVECFPRHPSGALIQIKLGPQLSEQLRGRRPNNQSSDVRLEEGFQRRWRDIAARCAFPLGSDRLTVRL